MLGAGAMGEVYEAVHTLSKKKVAIKFITADKTDPKYETLKKRFHDEAQAVRKINSPWIVKVIEINEDKTTGLYIAQELMPGTSLEDDINNGKKWTKREFIKNLATPLLSGLTILHKNGIIHRDIKSANLLITKNGSYKIADFGLAAFEGRQAKTKTGIIIGTPGYMAPESINGGRKATTYLSDIYSAGVTLYEAITGQPLFGSLSAIETIRKQLTTQVSVASLFNHKNKRLKIPRTCASVIVSALSIDPEKRPQSTEIFLNLLITEFKNINQSSTIELRPTLSQENTLDKENTLDQEDRLNKKNQFLKTTENNHSSEIKKKRSRSPKIKGNAKKYWKDEKKKKREKILYIFLMIVAIGLSTAFFVSYRFKPTTATNKTKAIFTKEKDQFIEAISEIDFCNKPLTIELFRKAINKGTIWLNTLKTSNLTTNEIYEIWKTTNNQLKDFSLPSLCSYIDSKTRKNSENLSTTLFLKLSNEIREYTFKQITLDTVKNISEEDISKICNLENFLIDSQLQNCRWTDDFSKFTYSASNLISNSENYIENLLTRVILLKQACEKPIFESGNQNFKFSTTNENKEYLHPLEKIEFAPIPYKLKLHLLRASVFADPSGILTMSIIKAPSKLVNKLENNLLQRNKRHNLSYDTIETEAISLDCSISIIKSIQQLLILYKQAKQKFHAKGCKERKSGKREIAENCFDIFELHKTLNRKIENKTATIIKASLKYFKESKTPGLKPSEKFQLTTKNKLYSNFYSDSKKLTTTLNDQYLTNFYALDKFDPKNAGKEFEKGILTMKGGYSKQQASKMIGDDKYSLKMRNTAVNLRRLHWYLHPLINCFQILKSSTFSSTNKASSHHVSIFFTTISKLTDCRLKLLAGEDLQK